MKNRSDNKICLDSLNGTVDTENTKSCKEPPSNPRRFPTP